MNKQKILLAHLNSNGDCLYASVIARQIKEVDHPGCHLTWAVNSKSKQTILHNPYVDEIWEYPTALQLTDIKEWQVFVQTAEARKKNKDFDVIYYTQIIGNNVIRLTGDIRPSTYSNYPHPITVPCDPIIRLTPEEVQHVKDFAEQHQLHQYKQVVLVECGPESFSLSLNPQSALEFANQYVRSNDDIAFILSSAKKTDSNNSRVIDASVLSFRENAELTKYCSLFIGCSSGISWMATTDWAKPLPKIIVINDHALFNTSMADDHAWCGLPTNHIIELKEGAGLLTTLEDCLHTVLNGSFEKARSTYHTTFKRKNFLYLHRVCKSSFDQWNFIAPIKAYIKATKKYGFSWNAVFHMLNAYVRLPYYIPRNLVRLIRGEKRY
jgi:hypothetical protein